MALRAHLQGRSHHLRHPLLGIVPRGDAREEAPPRAHLHHQVHVRIVLEGGVQIHAVERPAQLVHDVHLPLQVLELLLVQHHLGHALHRKEVPRAALLHLEDDSEVALAKEASLHHLVVLPDVRRVEVGAAAGAPPFAQEDALATSAPAAPAGPAPKGGRRGLGRRYHHRVARPTEHIRVDFGRIKRGGGPRSGGELRRRPILSLPQHLVARRLANFLRGIQSGGALRAGAAAG
mmetsp:Transcript_47152/g.151144  ORF Transcript_47152/g.151144 Transcript_47152/m.151144 type:complete len:234 (+) Transcript_47152:1158-1859(+)